MNFPHRLTRACTWNIITDWDARSIREFYTVNVFHTPIAIIRILFFSHFVQGFFFIHLQCNFDFLKRINYGSTKLRSVWVFLFKHSTYHLAASHMLQYFETTLNLILARCLVVSLYLKSIIDSRLIIKVTILKPKVSDRSHKFMVCLNCTVAVQNFPLSSTTTNILTIYIHIGEIVAAKATVQIRVLTEKGNCESSWVMQSNFHAIWIRVPWVR